MNYKVYYFSPANGVIVSPHTVSQIFSHRRTGESFSVSVDLGLGSVNVIRWDDGVEFLLDGVPVRVREEHLRRLENSDKLLFVGLRESYFLEIRDRGSYYKLKYLGKGVAPTLEINGVHMHNIVGTDPISDAKRKVKLVGVDRGDEVLDICTGLGYTAIRSLKRGARVVTIEKDKNVLLLAEHNPYSRDLVQAKIILGDAFYVLDELEEESFDKIIHDPPVFAFAGELYSAEFYKKMFRVLRKGGKVFHYTGSPGKHRGVRFQRGVVRRLLSVGFSIVKIIEGYGVLVAKD